MRRFMYSTTVIDEYLIGIKSSMTMFVIDCGDCA